MQACMRVLYKGYNKQNFSQIWLYFPLADQSEYWYSKASALNAQNPTTPVDRVGCFWCALFLDNQASVEVRTLWKLRNALAILASFDGCIMPIWHKKCADSRQNRGGYRTNLYPKVGQAQSPSYAIGVRGYIVNGEPRAPSRHIGTSTISAPKIGAI